MRRSFSTAALWIFFAAASAAAQSTDETAPPAALRKDAAPPADAKKTKKVWTNDNLKDANGAVSVVGGAKDTAKGNSNAAKPVDPKYLASVRQQKEKLQRQMDDIDKQITDLKNFKSGEPSTTSSGVALDKRYEREPIEVQIRALQDKKKDLQSKMDAVLDEARKKGVEPGQLR